MAKVDEAKRAGYAARIIAEVVTKWGVPIKQNVVTHHYLGTCACGRQ
jgi:hypothetical protein